MEPEGELDLASRARREVELAFGLHPTLGLATTRLVSGIAARVLAPDGELLDVLPGSEESFLAPLSARLLPTAQAAVAAARLDLLALHLVRDVQALTPAQLQAAFGALAAPLWREARGLDSAPLRALDPPPTAVAEETLAAETNDLRVLSLRVARLSIEVGAGLRARGTAARRLAVKVLYADGREGQAQGAVEAVAGERALRAAATMLLERALTRRVRVRRLRLEAWEEAPITVQLSLWGDPGKSPEGACEPSCGGSTGESPARTPPHEGEAQRPESIFPGSPRNDRCAALETTLHTLRARFGTSALTPASWLAHGLITAPPPRLRGAPRRPRSQEP